MPETCNPYNVLGPQGTKEVTPTVFSAAGGGKVQPLLHFRACVLVFGEKSFAKKVLVRVPVPPPGARPTDRRGEPYRFRKIGPITLNLEETR